MYIFVGYILISKRVINVRIYLFIYSIKVKPRYEAVRIGRRSADKTRPIKISVTNSNNVHEILLKSKNLRLSQHHKAVYISPDSELLQLASYVNCKVQTVPGRVILEPMKYFPPVFCRTEHFTPFERLIIKLL